MNNYDDIINLKRPNSRRPNSSHPHMPLYKRAAQFSPFAALTGYDDMVIDASKITDRKIDSYDELEMMISDKLNYINNHIKDKIKVIITYFSYKDSKYITKEGIVKRIDIIYKNIKLEDNTIIDINDIIDIDF